MEGIFDAIEVSSKGLSVQRAKMNVIAQNIANAETTETEEGGPYRRQHVLVDNKDKRSDFSSQLRQARSRMTQTNKNHLSGGTALRITHEKNNEDNMKIVESPADDVKMIYDPSHPNANEEGYVAYPKIEIVEEMVNMMDASRGYEANTVAISTAKKLAEVALDI